MARASTSPQAQTSPVEGRPRGAAVESVRPSSASALLCRFLLGSALLPMGTFADARSALSHNQSVVAFGLDLRLRGPRRVAAPFGRRPYRQIGSRKPPS